MHQWKSKPETIIVWFRFRPLHGINVVNLCYVLTFHATNYKRWRWHSVQENTLNVDFYDNKSFLVVSKLNLKYNSSNQWRSRLDYCKSHTRTRTEHNSFVSLLKEIDVQGKKAIVIFVPVPQLKAYQKIQVRLVRELEKKFSGKHVVFIAQVIKRFVAH